MCYGGCMDEEPTSADTPETSATTFDCPSCSQPVEVPLGPEEQVATCPHCGSEFTVPAATSDERSEPSSREAELDSLRIRQLGAAKRAAYRSRSYAVIGVIFCAAAAGQLIWNAIARVRSTGWTIRPILFLVFAGLFVWLTIYLVRRAIELTREAKETRLEEPTAPPDFSHLSDGSQRWKDLENIR